MPHFYGFCPSEAAWNRELKRLGVSMPYPTSDGRCSTFEQTKANQICTLVTVGGKPPSRLAVVGILVHEAMHVWRAMRETIGEAEPSAEFEAYQMQSISSHLIAAYEKTRGRLLL